MPIIRLFSIYFILLLHLTSSVLAGADSKIVPHENEISLCNVENTQTSVQSTQVDENQIATFFGSILSTNEWPARWYCGVWTPFHGWLYIGSDIAIWLAYFMIPLVLLYFIFRVKNNIPFLSIFILFIGFILACGLTHLIDAIIFWWPAYKLSALVRFTTALISWGTIIALIKIVPDAIKLKSPQQLEKMVQEKTLELQKSNEQLQKVVTSYKESEKNLSKANAKLEKVIHRTARLEAVNQELAAFSYSVSHDLKSPLRSIHGFSQALMEDCYDQLDETGKDYLKRVSNASLRMGNLIDDMLSLSKISRTELKKKDIDLSKIVRSVVKQQHLADNNIQINIETNLRARGDSQLLEVALNNLLSNAIKYSSKSERPVVEFGKARNTIPTFYVKDNGVGFDMQYAGNLFGVFQRLHANSDFEGTGIGLATVKRIIHRHGGKVWAHAELNKGAIFYFTLPESS